MPRKWMVLSQKPFFSRGRKLIEIRNVLADNAGVSNLCRVRKLASRDVAHTEELTKYNNAPQQSKTEIHSPLSLPRFTLYRETSNVKREPSLSHFTFHASGRRTN